VLRYVRSTDFVQSLSKYECCCVGCSDYSVHNLLLLGLPRLYFIAKLVDRNKNMNIKYTYTNFIVKINS